MKIINRILISALIGMFCPHIHAQDISALTARAKQALMKSIPETLLDETSYKAISFGALNPIYKTKDDVLYEIEQIKYLLSFVDEIILQNKLAGKNDDDEVIPKDIYKPYPWGLDSRLITLGYFTSDDFIYNNSFYNYNHFWKGVGCPSSYSRTQDLGTLFVRKEESMFWSTPTKKVSTYKEIKEKVLLPRYVELSNMLDTQEKKIIGYEMEHKYNANNAYGGAVTQSIKVYFDVGCAGYWYVENNTIHRIENVRGLK